MLKHLLERLFKVNRGTYSPIIIESNLSSFKEQGNNIDRNLIYRWNNKFPIDHWYREKYNIRFNSEEHRNTSFEDMIFEYIEDSSYNKIRIPNSYIPNEGNFIKINKVEEEKKVTMEEFLEEAKSIDLSQFNLDKKNGE
jgi:hypothetical protein